MRGWWSITSSSDGSRLVAVDGGGSGYIYTYHNALPEAQNVKISVVK